MGEKTLLQGNEAVCWGAVFANCEAYFGYPITPVNEVIEWCSREFPKRGKVFVQSASETGSANQLAGAASVGARAFTATSGPGWSLMQETIAHMAQSQLPGVIYLCQRGGVRHGQFEYNSACRGGGHGGLKNIVVAPASVRETVELTQLAFHLADKYRNPAVVLSDAIIGQMMEPVDLDELRDVDFGPLPSKSDWALTGVAHRQPRKRLTMWGGGVLTPPPVMQAVPSVSDAMTFNAIVNEKWKAIAENEVRYESYRVEGAELVLVAIGYAARVSREAVDWARGEGLRAGMIRPITVWPFPYEPIREVARPDCPILVVEDNLGQMVEDVRIAVEGRARVHHLGCLARHERDYPGMILPERVLAEVRTIVTGGAPMSTMPVDTKVESSARGRTQE